MQKYQDEHDTNKSTGPDNLSAGLLKNSSSKDFSRLRLVYTDDSFATICRDKLSWHLVSV